MIKNWKLQLLDVDYYRFIKLMLAFWSARSRHKMSHFECMILPMDSSNTFLKLFFYFCQLVRFYTRMGFKAVPEFNGSSISDLGHMLV